MSDTLAYADPKPDVPGTRDAPPTPVVPGTADRGVDTGSWDISSAPQAARTLGVQYASLGTGPQAPAASPFDASGFITQRARAVGIDPNVALLTWKGESGGIKAAPGDGGAARGPWQLHQEAIDDVNQKFGTNYTLADADDFTKATDIALRYLAMGKDATGSDMGAIAYYASGPGNLKAGRLNPNALPRLRQYATANGLPTDNPSLAKAVGVSNVYGFTPPGAGGEMPPYQQLFGGIAQTQQQYAGAAGRVGQRLEEEHAEDRGMSRALLKRLVDEPVDLQPWTKPPPVSDPVEGFASLGAVFAGLASAFTHTPMISAMTGMAAAIEARKKGNEDEYQRAYQTWKDNTELAIKRTKVLTDKFKAALELTQTDTAAANAELSALSATYGAQNAAQWAQIGAYDKINQWTHQQDDLRIRLMEVQRRLEGDPGSPNYIRNQLYQDYMREHPDATPREAWLSVNKDAPLPGSVRGMTPKERDIQTKAETDFQKAYGRAPDPNSDDDEAKMAELRDKYRSQGGGVGLTPQAVDMAAGQMMLTGKMPSIGYGSKGDREAIYNRFASMATEYGLSPEDVTALQSGVHADQRALDALGRVRANVGNFERTAQKELNLTREYMDKGAAPGQMPVFNRWVQAGRRSVEGDPDVSKFDAALISFKNEYARIMSSPGAAGGTTTDTARAEADSLINAAMSKDQLVGTMESMSRSMQNRRDGIDEEISATRNRLRIGGPTPAASTPAPATSGAPAVGEVRKGYRFKGGDPASPDAWEKVQ